jgi:hypothetical protein
MRVIEEIPVASPLVAPWQSSTPLIGPQNLLLAFQTQPTMAESDTQGADYEAQHVHSVYEEIASHFSSTRYKVCVARLLLTFTM